MRTTLRIFGTTGMTRRAPVATTLAVFCMALPLSGLLGGTAFAAESADVAALKAAASDNSKSEAAHDAAALKQAEVKTDAPATAAANKPADFIGPVAPAAKSDEHGKAAAPVVQPTPFVNQGGVTTGSNTTKYETVADRKGSTFTGKGGGQPSGDISSPQPFSTADNNNTGANDTSASNPYRSTRDGSPSLNGNGGGQQVGQPCAGCVGKADNKNPKGQAPNATDGNAGYECDRNHGIGRSNPAHTACTTGSTPPPTPTYDCEGHLLPNAHVHDCNPTKKYDCEGHELPNTHVHDCVDAKKITICHTTGSETNPAFEITISKNGLTGHEGHANDVIPPYTFKGVSYPGKNVGKPCGGTGNEPPKDCKGVVNGTATMADCTPPKTPDCKGVMGGNATAADCTPPKTPDCKGDMGGNATAEDCKPPVVCPAVGMVGPVPAGCRPSTPIGGGTGGEAIGNPPVVIVPNSPVITPIGGSPQAPAIGGTPQAPAIGGTPAAAAEGALPFTGTDALVLAQLAFLMLLIGGGLVGMGRTRKAIRVS